MSEQEVRYPALFIYGFCFLRRQTYHLRVAVERSQVEGCASVLVCVVGGSSALNQAADDGQMAFQTGPAQSGQTLLIHQRQRGSWEKETHSQASFTLNSFIRLNMLHLWLPALSFLLFYNELLNSF